MSFIYICLYSVELMFIDILDTIYVGYIPLDTLGFWVSATAGPGICSRLLEVGGAALHYYWGDAGAPLLG